MAFNRFSMFYTFFVLSVLSLQGSAHATEFKIFKKDVFIPGQNGIAHYRIPGVVVTPKGAILAYCEARKNNRSDWGEIEVHLRRSTDGGKTWSDAKQIAHHGERIEGLPKKSKTSGVEQTVNNPVAIVDKKTGAIEFLYCVNYARCYSMRSTDDGLTFSKPVEITSTFDGFRKDYDWNIIATGPGHGIQLKSGRLVVPFWLAFGKKGSHYPGSSGTIYSDDHGKTWNAGQIVMPHGGEFQTPNESIVTELSNGKVMMITRSVSKPNRKLVSTSPNGIDTWTKPKFHPELWEPVCMASVVKHPSGKLIYSNPHRLPVNKDGKEKPAGRGKRENLSLKVSSDDGKTWPINKTLEAGSSAYSDLALLPDDTVVCLYERDTRITISRIPMAWFDE